MEKRVWSVLTAFLFVFSLAGAAHSWQGRMESMGNPFGLVMDESDFLIHPAGIADGKEINFYGLRVTLRLNHPPPFKPSVAPTIRAWYSVLSKPLGLEAPRDSLWICVEPFRLPVPG